MAKRTLPLSKIRLDGNTQPRVELDEGLITEYKEAYQAGVKMPPLEVMFDGASYWLWDGFHRRWGAERAGMEKLPCNVTNGTQQDAQWASFGANVTHGLRRTNADKAKAVKAALRHPNGPKCSDRQIAEHCGVDHKTVSKHRAEMTGEIPQSDTRTGRDGRTTNTANIGKSKSKGKSKDVRNSKREDEPDVEMWPCHHCGGEHPIGNNPCHELDASGDTDQVSSEPFTDESDSAGVNDIEPVAAEKYRDRLIEWTRKQMDNIDDLTWPLARSVWLNLAESDVPL